MNENKALPISDAELLTYLVHGLDDEEERGIEALLESDVKIRKRMMELRQSLAPLTYDLNEEEPQDLMYKTLRKISAWQAEEKAKVKSAGYRPAPETQPSFRTPTNTGFPQTASSFGHHQSIWRRTDVILLIAVSLFVLLMLPAIILQVRHRAAITECSYNLKIIYQALHSFEEQYRRFPWVDFGTGPASRAGFYSVALKNTGLCGSTINFNCPGEDVKPYRQPPSMEEARQHNDCDFWKGVGGSYAYNVGYAKKSNNGFKVVPLDRTFGNQVPILADRPAREGENPQWLLANSPNHRTGQNVLYLGGHVVYEVTRNVKDVDNDIYLNNRGKYAPGVNMKDVVLLPSEVQVQPGTDWD